MQDLWDSMDIFISKDLKTIVSATVHVALAEGGVVAGADHLGERERVRDAGDHLLVPVVVRITIGQIRSVRLNPPIWQGGSFRAGSRDSFFSENPPGSHLEALMIIVAFLGMQSSHNMQSPV
jgi:hypothetical protein